MWTFCSSLDALSQHRRFVNHIFKNCKGLCQGTELYSVSDSSQSINGFIISDDMNDYV